MFLLQGQRGPATFFYPKAFVRHKAKMEVLPRGSLTELEVAHYARGNLKAEAVAVYGIRPDQIGAPGQFYKPEDINS